MIAGHQETVATLLIPLGFFPFGRGVLRVYFPPHSSLDSPSATWCMMRSTCSKLCNMQPHLPYITKRQPLPSCCSRAGWNTAPTFFYRTCTDNKDACTILGNIPKKQVRYSSSSSTSKTNHQPSRSNMGHAHPSSLEQSCQGATYYKQHIY